MPKQKLDASSKQGNIKDVNEIVVASYLTEKNN